MGYSDTIALQAGMADEANQIKAEQRAVEIANQAERFTSLFIGQPLSAYTGAMRRQYVGANIHTKVPQTVADMAMDAMECRMTIEQGIAALLAAVQLCARKGDKGDIDAMRCVGTLALAWGTQQVESAS